MQVESFYFLLLNLISCPALMCLRHDEKTMSDDVRKTLCISVTQSMYHSHLIFNRVPQQSRFLMNL